MHIHLLDSQNLRKGTRLTDNAGAGYAPESFVDSGIIHFGFSAGAFQPVINVRGDELFAGKELIRKWSSRETAY
jgi:hypothetical protein